MKRFYKQAAYETRDDGLVIALDGRPIRTPAARPLTVPTPEMADAIVAEWNGQGDEVDLNAMPITRLAGTGIDLVASRRDEIRAELVRYATTDLLCYRADTPEALAMRQAALWQPVLDWLDERHGIVLSITFGVAPIEQAPAALEALDRLLVPCGPMQLTGMRTLTGGLGSLVLALAVWQRHVDIEAAWTACQIDETFQAEQWGEDAEATARREALREDVLTSARFLELAGDDG